MMTRKPDTLKMGGLGLGLMLAACGQPAAQQDVIADIVPEIATQSEKSVALGPMIQTVKPGASVTFSSDVTRKLVAGENGVATITVNEGYPSGTLTLTARGEDGLSVFGAETTKRVDMSTGTTHTWRVDFAAESDGLYYIHVVADAEPENGLAESRAYAVRVEVGAWQAAVAKTRAAPDTLSSGELAVMMEAEETIE